MIAIRGINKEDDHNRGVDEEKTRGSNARITIRTQPATEINLPSIVAPPQYQERKQTNTAAEIVDM